MIPAEKLRPWLMDLKSAAFDAEDVLDLYEYENIKSKVSARPNSLTKFKGKAKEAFAFLLPKTTLKKIFEKLQQSANEAEKLLSLVDIVRKITPLQDNQFHRHPTVSGLSSSIFGRDEERDTLINMLSEEPCDEPCSSSKNISVLSVRGIGGSGKTTIAQYIYNDPRVEGRFDLRMWVHVSRTFDVHRITREIIESAAQDGCSHISNLDVLQTKLKNNLKSKKLLLVLDDVWCEDREQWEQLLVPLNEAGKVGSKILMTTRMEGVALRLGVKNVFHLKELKAIDCESILKHYAFGDSNKTIEDPELEQVMQEIVKRLKRSPLTARVIGSSLGKKVSLDQWKIILKDDMLKDTMDALYLSFQHLSPHLQRCFTICSLYPKGKPYVVDELVRLWIAEGFIETASANQLTPEEKGRQYFNDLLSYSFFQLNEHNSEGKYTYVIHDLLHDLAEKVCKGYCFRIEGEGHQTIPKTVMHLSITTDKIRSLCIPDILMLANLRTLIIYPSYVINTISSSDIDLLTKMLGQLTKLRVLVILYNYVLREEDFDTLCFVGHLKHLRYLQAHSVWKLRESLSRQSKISESLCGLYHLQYLLLDENNASEVPKSLSNLVNLRCVVGAENIREVKNIGNLASLQELKEYIVDRDASHNIGQLKSMHQLHGSLAIQNLENVKDKVEAMEAMLKDKQHLEKLKLLWNGDSIKQDCRDEEEVLEGLEPHLNLKELQIWEYQGAKSPSWMQHSLRNLQSLHLYFCYNLRGLPYLPPDLKRLHISCCHNLMEVCPLPHSLNFLAVVECKRLVQLSPFPCSLESLYVTDCPGVVTLLSSLSNDDYNGNGDQNKASHCPISLREIDIHSCPVVYGKTHIAASLQEKFGTLYVDGLAETVDYIRCHGDAAAGDDGDGDTDDHDQFDSTEVLISPSL